jgi:hypothetical protein
VQVEKSTMETGALPSHKASFFIQKTKLSLFSSTEKNLKNSYITKESTIRSKFMIMGTFSAKTSS